MIDQASRRLDELGRLVHRNDLDAALAVSEGRTGGNEQHGGIRTRVAIEKLE